MAIPIQSHIYVSKHTKATEKEIEELFKRYKISKRQLPKIYRNDPAIKEFDIEKGDIIKVIRKSPTNNKFVVYRVVV